MNDVCRKGGALRIEPLQPVVVGLFVDGHYSTTFFIFLVKAFRPSIQLESTPSLSCIPSAYTRYNVEGNIAVAESISPERSRCAGDRGALLHGIDHHPLATTTASDCSGWALLHVQRRPPTVGAHTQAMKDGRRPRRLEQEDGDSMSRRTETAIWR